MLFSSSAHSTATLAHLWGLSFSVRRLRASPKTSHNKQKKAELRSTHCDYESIGPNDSVAIGAVQAPILDFLELRSEFPESGRSLFSRLTNVPYGIDLPWFHVVGDHCRKLLFHRYPLWRADSGTVNPKEGVPVIHSEIMERRSNAWCAVEAQVLVLFHNGYRASALC